MNLSPLQLRHYTLQKISVEPVSGWKQKQKGRYPSAKGLQITAEVEVGVAKSDPNSFGIRLSLSANPKSDQYPYRFEIGIEGFVEMIGFKDSADKRDIAAVNGVSLLYGVVRDTLLTLTHRFEYGPALLPTLHFQALRSTKDATKVIAKQRKNRKSDSVPIAP